MLKLFKSIIRKIFLPLASEWAKAIFIQCLNYSNKFNTEPKITFWKKLRIFPPTSSSPTLSYAKQFSKIATKIKPTDTHSTYFYPYDRYLLRITPPDTQLLASVTADFGKVLDTDLNALRNNISKCPAGDFQSSLLSILKDIERLIDRTTKRFSKSSSMRKRQIGKYLQRIKTDKPSSLDEALQRILFFNGLFWQMRHRHVGLGRLDKILYPYYANDIEQKIISRSQAKQMLIDFCDILHKDCLTKSGGLIGDTGQYILLGGRTEDTSALENDITHLFLEIFSEHPYADPKLILRVNQTTSELVWNLAIKSVSKGSGSPLIMNEEPVIKGMREFGYDEKDLSEVGTSACWEPLIIGKSMDQNNPFLSVNLLQILNHVISKNTHINSYSELKQIFLSCIRDEIRQVVPKHIIFDVSPLFSLYFDDCINRNKDFSEGGARYAWHGAQCIGLPNTVNALINIEDCVFNRKLLTLSHLQEVLNDNFQNHEDIRLLLKNGENKFGKASDTVLSLTNEIMDTVSAAAETITCNGHKIKIGFSSPNYITLREHTDSSADGRIKGEPLAVHISPTSSDIDINEILDFATKLNYGGNRLNGNVVDFILPQSYIKTSDKLVALLKTACDNGVFEIQLNVVDKATLIDAKLHPEQYSDLIVRVWGFSAYFNDLPEAFKDNLIERAETYEGSVC